MIVASAKRTARIVGGYGPGVRPAEPVAIDAATGRTVSELEALRRNRAISGVAAGIDVGLADHHPAGLHPSILHAELDQVVGHLLQKLDVRPVARLGQVGVNTVVVQAVGQCSPGEPVRVAIESTSTLSELRRALAAWTPTLT